jgi:hypothetical protein
VIQSLRDWREGVASLDEQAILIPLKTAKNPNAKATRITKATCKVSEEYGLSLPEKSHRHRK